MYVCSSPIYINIPVCMMCVVYTTTFFSVVSFECLFHHHHTKLYIYARRPIIAVRFFFVLCSSKLYRGELSHINVTLQR